jgi:hypothetical protein
VQPTGLAGGPAPREIKQRLQLVEHQVVGGDDAKLEVATVLIFGAQSGTCEIGAAHVGTLSVDDDGLQMDARAHAHLESAGDATGGRSKARASFEISREGTRRGRGVKKPYFDASGDESLKQHEHGIEIVLTAAFASDAGQNARDGNHQLLEIGGGNPDTAFCAGDGTDHGVGVSAAGHKPNRHVALLSDEISR